MYCQFWIEPTLFWNCIGFFHLRPIPNGCCTDKYNPQSWDIISWWCCLQWSKMQSLSLSAIGIVLRYDINVCKCIGIASASKNKYVILYCYFIAKMLIIWLFIGVVFDSKSLCWSTLYDKSTTMCIKQSCNKWLWSRFNPCSDSIISCFSRLPRSLGSPEKNIK